MARGLIHGAPMLRTALRVSLLLGLASLFVAAIPAHAASPSCEDRLEELSGLEQVLEQLDHAITQGGKERAALRAESERLGMAITRKRQEGAPQSTLDRMHDQRRKALAELQRREALAPKVLRQRDALADAVTEAQRGYVACVDASLE